MITIFRIFGQTAPHNSLPVIWRIWAEVADRKNRFTDNLVERINRVFPFECPADQLKEVSAHSYLAPYNFAVIYAGLGDKDQSFAWLDRAYADQSSFLSFFPKTDAHLDNLRSDPSFADLLRRIGLPQ